MLIMVAVVISLLCSVADAQEAGQKARSAYQHFYCHHIIPLMADADSTKLLEQHENHVWAGIREARKMMTEIEKFKSANQEDWLEHAPANWGNYLNAGPSEDFVIGMLYEQVRGVVERQILQEEDGRYVPNIALYQENARASYDENGCKDLK
jgi:hypothetical protein